MINSQHLSPDCVHPKISSSLSLFVLWLVCLGLLVIYYCLFNPLPDNKILDRSKLKQSAEGNFKFDENSRKFSKQVENTVGKGEIARYKKFLLCLPCFQRLVSQGHQKLSLCGNVLNFLIIYTFHWLPWQTRLQHFQCFDYTICETNFIFEPHVIYYKCFQ